MGFTLGTLFESILLVVNALAILHEDRFLKPYGWGSQSIDINDNSAKAKMIQLLHAVRMLMRIPLVFVNVAVIVFELLLG